VPARFSLDDYRKRQMKFPKRPSHDVTIRFSRDVARWVREDREYRGERIDETPEGDLIVTHRAGNLAYLLNRVLQYGKNAEILAPAEVRAEMRRHLDAALAALGSPKTSA
jgi:predicted DNA-binding transcriptional regulator YafY